MRYLFFFILITMGLLTIQRTEAQNTYADSTRNALHQYHRTTLPHSVAPFDPSGTVVKPDRIILMIGDGMAVAHLTAALVANSGSLYMQQFRHIGITTTHSANDFITDSGAAGTALATGRKTYNGAIGVSTDTLPMRNIREVMAGAGYRTGVVSTSAVTHATPAAFVAHQPCRKLHEAIAADFVQSGVDLFMGGGLDHFARRTDGRNLVAELQQKGYVIDTQSVKLNPVPSPALVAAATTKYAGLYAAEHLVPSDSGRGEFLATATRDAINILNKSPKGFFLMVEGSQIDWGGHDNNTAYIITETLDFDRAVGEALRFAAADRRTLVIVTSDHETGGMTLHAGDYQSGHVTGAYTSGEHTGTMVPVFAFGPGAEQFAGFYDNTELPKRIAKLLGLQL